MPDDNNFIISREAPRNNIEQLGVKVLIHAFMPSCGCGSYKQICSLTGKSGSYGIGGLERIMSMCI